jgi:hypothetical protein
MTPGGICPLRRSNKAAQEARAAFVEAAKKERTSGPRNKNRSKTATVVYTVPI